MNHRIIEWLKIIKFQPLCHGQGHFPLHQILKVPSNLALNTSREGTSTMSLGNLCQCLTTLTGKNFFLRSNLNLPSFSLKLLPLITTPPDKESLPIFSVGPL